MGVIRKYLLGLVILVVCLCGVFEPKLEAHAQVLPQVTDLKQVDDDWNPCTMVKITWKAINIENVYYEISYTTKKNANANEWKIYSTDIERNECTLLNLSAATDYYIRVRTWRYQEQTSGDSCVSEVPVYGPYSKIVQCVTAPKAKVTKVKKTNCTTTSITLTWNKAKNVDGYIVKYWLTNPEQGKEKLVTKNTVKLTGLKKNQNYYVAVYSICMTDDKKYHTPASASLPRWEGEFGVTPSKVSGVSVGNMYHYNLNYMGVSCKHIDCADGYEAEVWTAYKKKDTKIASAKSVKKYYTQNGNKCSSISTPKIKKNFLNTTDFLKVRVRAYTKLSSGKKKYGKWSDWKYTSGAPTDSNYKTDIYLSRNGTFNLGWDEIKGADKYVVHASLKPNSGYKKIGTTTNTTMLITQINNKPVQWNTSYYIRVTPYHKGGNKYYKGNYSTRCLRWGK